MLAPTYSPPCGVPSAMEDLTAVFGMRTGVAPPINHQDNKFKKCLKEDTVRLKIITGGIAPHPHLR